MQLNTTKLKRALEDNSSEADLLSQKFTVQAKFPYNKHFTVLEFILS
jgi:hypothetical protein